MRSSKLQPLRVLFIDHVPRLSGAEQSLSDLVVGLSGPVEPIVVLPGDGPLAADLRAHGVLVRMVPMSRRMLETSRTTLAQRPFIAVARLFSFLIASWRILRLVREVRPAIVHTNTLKSHLLAIIPCRFARVPLVWHLRDILPDGWLRRAVVSCARFASAVIVPSRAVAEPFRGNRRVQRKLRLIPNGIRVEDFQDAKRDRSLREAMGVGASDPVVGIVARIAPWKGQDVFLRAAAMLARRYPRAHFAVVGSGMFGREDESYERALHQMVLAEGLEDRVSFLGWQPAPEAMAALDIVVHASRDPEPFGRSIVEAMASGKPVVAADGGAVREILPPSAGFIVPPARPDLLADALDRLLADRKLRKRVGESGAAIADSFFPVARTIGSVALVYRALGAAAAKKRGAARTRARRWTMRSRVRPVRPSTPPAPSHAARWSPVPPPPPAMPAPARTVALDVPHAVRPRGWRRQRRVETEPAVLERREVLPISGAQDVGVLTPVLTPARLAPKPMPVAAPIAEPVAPPRPVRAPARETDDTQVFPAAYRAKPLYDVAKRVLDVAIALAVLIVGLPLWLVLAVLIKLESRGPVLHRGTVYGKSCEPFTYFKFRSMRVDGCDQAHRRFIERYVRENGGHDRNGETVYKMVDDDRVTSVGRFIRKFSIDEVPQLLNVLRGEMSIVGPRPPLDYEYDLYDASAKARMCVLPGITGLQQVEARHEASFEEKLRLDTEYVARRSILTDVGIILRTIPAAFRGH